MARRPILTRCIDRLAYGAVRVLICIVQALPRDFCERGARRLSGILANRLRIRRQVVRDNLRSSFPALTAVERSPGRCGSTSC
jgi:lauroyl/myristoyl acyltransferase